MQNLRKITTEPIDVLLYRKRLLLIARMHDRSLGFVRAPLSFVIASLLQRVRDEQTFLLVLQGNGTGL